MSRNLRFRTQADLDAFLRANGAKVGELLVDMAEKRKPARAERGEGGSEHATQCACFEWWDAWAPTIGLPARLLFAIPNAGAGAQKGRAGWLKAEGVKAGTADTFLSLPRGRYHGLYLELKHGRNDLSPEQRSFREAVMKQDYGFTTVRSIDEFQSAIRSYLAMPPLPLLAG